MLVLVKVRARCFYSYVSRGSHKNIDCNFVVDQCIHGTVHAKSFSSEQEAIDFSS